MDLAMLINSRNEDQHWRLCSKYSASCRNRCTQCSCVRYDQLSLLSWNPSLITDPDIPGQEAGQHDRWLQMVRPRLPLPHLLHHPGLRLRTVARWMVSKPTFLHLHKVIEVYRPFPHKGEKLPAIVQFCERLLIDFYLSCYSLFFIFLYLNLDRGVNTFVLLAVCLRHRHEQAVLGWNQYFTRPSTFVYFFFLSIRPSCNNGIMRLLNSCIDIKFAITLTKCEPTLIWRHLSIAGTYYWLSEVQYSSSSSS